MRPHSQTSRRSSHSCSTMDRILEDVLAACTLPLACGHDDSDVEFVRSAQTATEACKVLDSRSFVRTRGRPNEYEVAFEGPPGRSGRFAVVVTNGASGRCAHRVSSATISLNETKLFGPDDFSERVSTLQKLVALADHNILRVRLNSAPDSFLAVAVSRPDGSSCSDGNQCNGEEICQTGTCVAGVTAPIVLPAPDACHAVGSCNPQTGTCFNPSVADGTECDDADASRASSCVAGACLGTDRVTCTPSDRCHEAGVCMPDTGMCTGPVIDACVTPEGGTVTVKPPAPAAHNGHLFQCDRCNQPRCRRRIVTGVAARIRSRTASRRV